MANLWRHDGREWIPQPLADAPSILRASVGFGGAWMLLGRAGADLVVNGEPVRLGMVALRDRDEIRLADGSRLFFSAEESACVVPLLEAPPGLRCARCQRVFAASVSVVRCPGEGCGLVHHETPELPCWSYDERCAVCPQATVLDGSWRWTPEAV